MLNLAHSYRKKKEKLPFKEIIEKNYYRQLKPLDKSATCIQKFYRHFNMY